MQAHRELARRWREARAKKLAEHWEVEEGDIVKQAPQGFKPERRTRKPREQEEKLTILVRNSRHLRPRGQNRNGKSSIQIHQKKDESKNDKGGTKKGGSVQNTIAEIIEASKLPPAEQALLPPKRLTTKVTRPKKDRKDKGGGLEPILEHNDVQDDPYYMKPPLPTQIK